MQMIFQDFRFSLRLLARRPAVSMTTILTLALGIGVCTAMFSVVNAVLIQPLPYPAPERLVTLWETHPQQGGGFRVTSLATAEAWREELDELAGVALSSPWRPVLSREGQLVSLQGAKVSVDFFPLLGIEPILGRGISADDDRPGADPVVLLSHALWQRRFGGDEHLVGRTIQLEGSRFSDAATVIGILPKDLRIADPLIFESAEIWAPLAMAPSPVPSGRRYLRAFGRLQADTPLEIAHARLESVSQHLADQHPKTHQDWHVGMERLSETIAAPLRPALLALLAGVGLVFLVACCNAGILLLSQATTRRREIALRLALGATPARIGRQVLSESLMLAAASGLLGLLTASQAARLASSGAFTHLSGFHDVAVDLRVLLFACGLSLTTVLLFGLIPAFRAARVEPFSHLRFIPSAGGRKANHLRRWLMAGEVALSLVLLTVAALMLESFERLATTDPGFEAPGVMTLRVQLPGSLQPEASRRDALYRRLLAEVDALPQVEQAGLVNHLPMAGSSMATEAAAENAGDHPIQVELRGASQSYFHALGIPLRTGSQFEGWDSDDGQRRILLSQTAAERLWPGEEVIGRRIRLEWGSRSSFEVAGVVGDIRHQGMWSEARPTVYLPYLELPHRTLNLVVRSASSASVIADIRARAHALDRAFVFENIRPLEDILGETIAEPRSRAQMSAAFALITLMLAAGGAYSVIAYSVAQRRYDFSVRQALGARPGQLVRGTLADGARWVVAGVVIGLTASLMMARALSGLLYGVSSHDPSALVGSTILMSVVVLLATYLPASRAMKADPAADLRSV